MMPTTPLVSGPDALRNAVQFGQDPLSFLDTLRGETDGAVRARFGVGPSLLFVTDPQSVERILVDEQDTFWRPDILSSRTKALTANGLIQSDGDLWERQRSRLQPLFGVDRLESYVDTIGSITETVLSDWNPGKTVSLYEEMSTITVRVIARELLGRDLIHSEIERIQRTSAAVAREFTMSPVALLRQILPTPPSREYREAIDDMHGWAEALITDYRNNEHSGADNLVTVMLAAEEEPGTELEPNLIRDEVLTFLFAGYETTALTLSFALWFCSRQPELGEQIRTEAREAAGSNTLEWSDLPELTTAKRVINETLRLRPASWGLLREARSDARLGDVAVRDGDFLMLPQWTLHRDARFFENPETFDPTRWRDRDPNQTQAYFPFGAGPQSCIGGRLATTEATLVLASVFRDYEIETTTEAINNLRVAGVLRPRDGVPATLTSV